MDKNNYSASFAHVSTVLSLWNKGYSLAGGLRSTTRDVAYKNCLVVGPSGAGKTSCVLIGTISTLARGKSSICVLDVSGEIFDLTSGYLAKKGYKIYRIVFGPKGDSFNPLSFCTSLNEISKLAFLLIRNSGIEAKSDPYWSQSGEMMLGIFIEYLVFYAPPEHRNMANLVRLTDMFAANPVAVHKLFIKTNKDLLTKYKAMNSVGEKTLNSTLSTVRTALKIFNIPEIQQCTATTTIDFASFRKEKSILYICTPLNDVNQYAPLSALLFEALFKEIFSRIPDAKEHSIFCLMDELVTMRFQNLGQVFSTCRKYLASCMGIIQDEKMLEMAFSTAEAHAIKTNSFCKVYLPGQPLATCKQLEEILGCYSYKDEKGIERNRHLMSASEIRMISNQAIILVGNKAPILARLKPFYTNFILKLRTEIPPVSISGRNSSLNQSLIQFDESEK